MDTLSKSLFHEKFWKRTLRKMRTVRVKERVRKQKKHYPLQFPKGVFYYDTFSHHIRITAVILDCVCRTRRVLRIESGRVLTSIHLCVPVNANIQYIIYFIIYRNTHAHTRTRVHVVKYICKQYATVTMYIEAVTYIWCDCKITDDKDRRIWYYTAWCS